MPDDNFGSRATLRVGDAQYEIQRLDALINARVGHVDRLPLSLKILTDNLLRRVDGRVVRADDVLKAAGWNPDTPPEDEIAFICDQTSRSRSLVSWRNSQMFFGCSASYATCPCASIRHVGSQLTDQP